MGLCSAGLNLIFELPSVSINFAPHLFKFPSLVPYSGQYWMSRKLRGNVAYTYMSFDSWNIHVSL